MKPSLRVLSPGLSTTVQDLGRFGFQRLGVSVSGALDPVAFGAANALVGNPRNTGALEAIYTGPSLATEADSARLAFAGADAAIEILPDAEATSGEMIAPGRSVHLRRGQVVRIGSIKNGATLYVAAEGGFDIAPVLGSVATDSRSNMGGWHGRPLIEGDILPLRRAAVSDREECQLEGVRLAPPSPFRAVLGPQSDHFSDAEIERFFAADYVVSAGSNRMGMRLQGPPLRHRRGFNIVSDAIANGAIQVPGSGQPIVLLADHQTTGGYPKIANVISADLPALSRLPIGAKIRFAPVSLEEATAARREFHAALSEIGEKIVPIKPAPAAVAARLLECNLISGVCDAAA
ncbi:MAG TPA: biotin-dependent carboxyltransferase family protein [Xanthobacteraceae bacterium]|nr:biotin-dependent carboxyltransferase family protein [Xanthobacteraceae bacterium]